MTNAPPENCLLGKVIADNHILHKQSVILIFRNAWKKHYPVTISPWKNNFFKFAFDNKEDIPKILRDSPWTLLDTSLGILSSEYARELAMSFGKLIELDRVGEGPQTDRDFLRFR
ncbi:reverse transcriptase, partial [Tanacetum coccineum]